MSRSGKQPRRRGRCSTFGWLLWITLITVLACCILARHHLLDSKFPGAGERIVVATHSFPAKLGGESSIQLTGALAAGQPEVELTLGRPALADVPGNIGPASVVTKQQPGLEWLKDRWQADMSGTNEHWIQVDLGISAANLTRVVIDFETAYAREYALETADSRHETWHPLVIVNGSEGKFSVLPWSKEYGKHVEHTLLLPQAKSWVCHRYLRVRFTRPATSWGISVWRFRVYGRAAPQKSGSKTPDLVELTLGRPAFADVRGNLGNASVVTKSEEGKDWLADRWQADMSGVESRREHWIEIDLGYTSSRVNRGVMDFETAHPETYVLETADLPGGPWHQILTVNANVTTPSAQFKIERRPKHVVHYLEAAAGTSWTCGLRVRVRFLRAATQWGISVWRIRLFGFVDK